MSFLVAEVTSSIEVSAGELNFLLPLMLMISTSTSCFGQVLDFTDIIADFLKIVHC